MSQDEEKVFDTINDMDIKEAKNALLTILASSNNWQHRNKAADLLLKHKRIEGIDKLKNAYTKENHPQTKIKIMELLLKYFKDDGALFLKTRYDGEIDWKVRKSIKNRLG